MPRETPTGEPLPGINKESYWTSQLKFPSPKGFKEQFKFAIALLEKEKETLDELKASGGKIEIYLMLSGAINNGGTIESDWLKKMGELGVDLLIEVFVGV